MLQDFIFINFVNSAVDTEIKMNKSSHLSIDLIYFYP